MLKNRRRRHLLRLAAALSLAIIGSVVASFGNIQDEQHRVGEILPAVAGAALVLMSGIAAVRIAAHSVRESAVSKLGDAKGSGLAKLIGVSGTVVVVLWMLSTLGIGLQGLLLGGALTGVVLGIAAQQTLGNIIAGIVLLVVKPFEVGEETVIKSGLGEYEGRVSNIGFMYVSILTANGQVDVPNAVVLASAVGPGARTGQVEPVEPAAQEEAAGD